jgi:hypothetical protein
MAYQSSDGVSAGTVSADEIGVGTSAPNYEIEVKASNARIAATSDGGVVNHLQSNSTTGFVGTHTNHPLALKTNGSERVRIDSSGNVKLSGDETELQFNSDTGVGNNVRARIQCEGQTGTYGYGGDLVFKTTADNNTSAERLRITSSALVMGSGMAIDFGSGASTTLDAYEEGTHTATLTPQTSGTITLNSATDTIAYTKIGRMVTITGNLSVSAVSSPTGDFVKISLPFVVGNYDKTSGDFAAPIFLMNAAFAISSYRLIGIEGDSFLRIYRTTSTGVSGANTASDFSGNEAIYLSCTYQTTA